MNRKNFLWDVALALIVGVFAYRVALFVMTKSGMKPDYLAAVQEFCAKYKEDCARAGIDYLATDTSIGFDKPFAILPLTNEFVFASSSE